MDMVDFDMVGCRLTNTGVNAGLFPMELVQKILQGDPRAVARLMTLIENGAAESVPALKSLYQHTGRAHVVGVTGPPGSGKSTLTDRITEELRGRGETVGIVAVDPTSPFTGGAILADRIRMQRHSVDPGVFIRSMATRGHLGGLARATNDVVDVLDAAGKDYVLIETVGVGQDEVDVVRAAHTSIVVAVPGLGDDIQAIKAGVMEIGDVFVVNKADRDGADKTAAEIEMALHLGGATGGWLPRVLKTVALKGEGVAELTQVILEHQAFLQQHEGRRQKGRERGHWVFRELLQERATTRVIEQAASNGTLDRLIERIAARETDPYTAVEEVLKKAGL
jgi:LAO/AO transport system kinase